MIQFNFNRFGKLAKWSLTNDKGYYVKTFLQVLVVLLLVFLFFTSVANTNDNRDTGYHSCSTVALLLLVIQLVVGPSVMFYSMEGKHDRQSLMVLPASNFEKYVMRYSTWLIQFPFFVVAFFGADLMQYVFHLVLGHDYGQFVTAGVANVLSKTIKFSDSTQDMHSSIVICVWMHSVFALGATFFRSRKFNGVLSLAVIIMIGILVIWLAPKHSMLQYDHESTTLSYVLGSVIYIGLILLNFWLSYRLFCRQQVIGKFINL